MKSAFYFLIIIGLLAVSCSEKETPGGVKYTILKKGDGKTVAFGDFMSMSLLMKDAKDSVWFDSKLQGNAVILPVPDASMDKDTGEMGVFKMLTKGDSVKFQLTAEVVFTKTRRMPVPKNVPPGSLFTFYVSLKEVMNKDQVNEFQQKMVRESQRAQIKKDSLAINDFLIEKGLVAQTTASGLRYVVTKEGKGDLAVSGKTVMVHYAGYLLNGKLFDTSLASVAKAHNLNKGGLNEPYPVVVNTGSVIRGWDEMLMLMNKGMKVTVIVPSSLAYGPQSRGPEIPAYSVLVFDLEVVDIK